MRCHHPDVEVHAQHVAWSDVRAALLEHRVDAVVTRLPFPTHPGRPATDQLHVTVLHDEPRVVIVPRGHRLAGEDRVTLDDIADEPMPRLLESDPVWSAYWRIDPRPDGRPAPDGPVIDALEDKLELVAAGEAVVIGTVAMGDLRPDVTAIPLEGVEPSHVVLATRADDHSRVVGAFRRYAREHLAGPIPLPVSRDAG